MGANLSSPEGSDAGHRARRKEETPFRLLTVRILRARNIHKADLFTESDCYVSLTLPTASSETVQTKTIPNTKDPTWNQAFTYRIDSRVKNILHLKICDEDTFTKDDHLYTVLFDVGKLETGRTSRMNFRLNTQTREELEVEFTLQAVLQRQGDVVRNTNAVAHTSAPALAPAPPRTGIFASGARWIRWLRSIDIPRPPGF